MAHRKAIGPSFPNDPRIAEYSPGIFRLFRPSRIEYVVKGDETDDELEALAARGVDLVNVKHQGDPVGPLFDDDEPDPGDSVYTWPENHADLPFSDPPPIPADPGS